MSALIKIKLGYKCCGQKNCPADPVNELKFVLNSNKDKLDKYLYPGNMSVFEFLMQDEELNDDTSTLKKYDIVRSIKQNESVIPYLIEDFIGEDAKCLNLIDTYTIPVSDLYSWVVKK